MKHIIWLSPSLAAGAIAARLVAFFERRPQIRDRRGVERVSTMRRRVPAPSPVAHESHSLRRDNAAHERCERNKKCANLLARSRQQRSRRAARR
jgi:hypothetical protein